MNLYNMLEPTPHRVEVDMEESRKNGALIQLKGVSKIYHTDAGRL